MSRPPLVTIGLVELVRGERMPWALTEHGSITLGENIAAGCQPGNRPPKRISCQEKQCVAVHDSCSGEGRWLVARLMARLVVRSCGSADCLVPQHPVSVLGPVSWFGVGRCLTS